MEQTIYDKKSVHSLILYFSVPAIFSLIVEIMASVVDTVFAGHLGEASMDALAAMGLLSPMLSIYTAVQALFAVSTAVMIARHLTCKEVRTEYFLTGLGMTLVLSVMISIGSFLLMPGLLSLLGAEGQAAVLAEKYLRIQLFSNVFSALGYTLTSCIRAFGCPAMEMGITSLSVVVNIVLNAVFVFGFDWGFAGLACGTFVSELFCCVLSVLWLKHHRLLELKCALSWEKFKSHTAELLKVGIAQTIIQSLGGCTAFCVNQSLMLYTTMNHVAVWNVAQQIYTLFLMPIVGITQGVQTIIAYFDGQQEEDKRKKTLVSTIGYTVLYGLLGVVLIDTFGADILSVFSNSSAVCQLGNKVLRIIFLMFPLMGIFYTIMTLYEVTGHEGKAVFLILMRQVILMIPLVFLLPRIMPEYPLAIFCSVPIADTIAMVLSVYKRNGNVGKKSRACSRKNRKIRI